MKVDREWLRKQVVVELAREDETDISWRREFEDQRESYQWIESELAAGNRWAWCSVKVTVAWRTYQAEQYLGGCSYASRDAFVREGEGGYYEDLVREGVAEIATQIEAMVSDHALWEHDVRSCLLCIADGVWVP